MDQIEKFIRKLLPRERLLINQTVKRLDAGDWAGLNVKKLQGVDDLFRVRIGRIRIIYRFAKISGVQILDITYRDDTTYNF